MKTTFFPTFNGVVCQSDNQSVVSVINDKAFHYVDSVEINKKSIYHEKIPFLRGLEYFFFGLYIFFKCQFIGIDRTSIFEKQGSKFSFFSILFSCIATLSLFFSIFLFGFFSSKFNNIFAGLLKTQFQINLSMALIKVAILLVILLSLKYFNVINKMYSFNYATNKIQNQEKNVTFLSGHKPTNFLNFIVSTLIFNMFFITLFGFSIHPLLKHLINIGIFIIGISVVYELDFYLEKTKLRCIILISSFFVTARSNATSELIVSSALWEMKLLKENSQRKMEKLVGDRTVVSLSQVVAYVSQKLKEKNINIENEEKWLIAGVLGKKKNDLKFITTIKKSDEQRIKKVLERRLKGEPLDKIFGVCDFFSLQIKVSRDVLTPRPETELLVESVLEKIKTVGKPKVLDLCTGSGAIGIAIKHSRTDATVTASDISEKALELAQENARDNLTKITFKQSNMFEGLNKSKKYDIIVSNPPYIKTSLISGLDKEVRNFDPMLALDGGIDGLKYYKIIAEKSSYFLKKNGIIALEIDHSLGKKIKKLLSKHFNDIEIVKDYDGNDRFIFAKVK